MLTLSDNERIKDMRLRYAIVSLISLYLLVGGMVLIFGTHASPIPTPTTTLTATQEPVLEGTDAIYEDDMRWNCITMGNHTCGTANGDTLIYFQDNTGAWHGYNINDSSRPGCFVEPSTTESGYEIIYHQHIASVSNPFAFEVNCPN